jgi:hypothetical protein
MKLIEIIDYIKSWHSFGNGEVKLFDIASLPCMFVVAADYQFGENLYWRACALIEDKSGKALGDNYGIYLKHKNYFIDCDLTISDDIEKVRKEFENNTFDLITGDVGIGRIKDGKDDYTHLDEENNLDVEWGQMVCALKLTKINDMRCVVVLKMYTTISRESEYLINVLAHYFNNVKLVKPYSSRVLNDECYIICVGRNEREVDDELVPNTRPLIEDQDQEEDEVDSPSIPKVDEKNDTPSIPKVGNEVSINRNKLIEFNNAHADIKNKVVEMLVECVKHGKDDKYDVFYKEIYPTFMRMRTINE